MRTSDWSSDVCSSDLLVGDRPTLADALFIGVARWLDFHEVAEPVRWPKLAALRARLEADPAVAYTTALEIGENAAAGGACLGHGPPAEVNAGYGARSRGCEAYRRRSPPPRAPHSPRAPPYENWTRAV